jgi:hypothetical protein
LENADESDGETESSSGEYDSDDPTAELIRETKREVAAEKRKSEKTQKSPRGPPRTDMGFRGLSLSGGPKPRDMSTVECFKCGEKGHMSSGCPKPRGSNGRGRGRGRR